MIWNQEQRRNASVTVFGRACAVLCLFLLCLSAAHTALGHSAISAPAAHVQAGLNHEILPPATDSPDACVLCVAMATAVPLHIFSVDVPQTAQPRPPVPVAIDGPVTGWHAALSCRPPPAS